MLKKGQCRDQEVLPRIRQLGARVVATSPQSLEATLSTAEKKELAFAVLSDRSNQVARVTVLVVGPTQTAIIDKFGLDPASMPMKPMSVEQCVFEGLEALKKNRASVINGRVNRVMNALIPVKVQKGMMKKMMERGLVAQGKLLLAAK